MRFYCLVVTVTALVSSGCSDDGSCTPVACGDALQVEIEPRVIEPGEYTVTATSERGVSVCEITLDDGDTSRRLVDCTGDFDGSLRVENGGLDFLSFFSAPESVSIEIRREGIVVRAVSAPLVYEDDDARCSDGSAACSYALLTATPP